MADLASICATRGHHLITGHGNGTGTIIYADHCSTCGAKQVWDDDRPMDGSRRQLAKRVRQLKRKQLAQGARLVEAKKERDKWICLASDLSIVVENIIKSRTLDDEDIEHAGLLLASFEHEFRKLPGAVIPSPSDGVHYDPDGVAAYRALRPD